MARKSKTTILELQFLSLVKNLVLIGCVASLDYEYQIWSLYLYWFKSDGYVKGIAIKIQTKNICYWLFFHFSSWWMDRWQYDVMFPVHFCPPVISIDPKIIKVITMMYHRFILILQVPSNNFDI